jgi:hypothetical protein
MRIIALLVIVTGCNTAQHIGTGADARGRGAIQAVDARYDEIRVLRNKLEETKDCAEQSAAVAFNLDAMSALDLSVCPSDVVEAFRAYLSTWRKFSYVLANSKADTKPEAAERDRRWDAVLALARSHGAVK